MGIHINDLDPAIIPVEDDLLLIETAEGTKKISIQSLLQPGTLDSLNLADSSPFDLVAAIHNAVPGRGTVNWDNVELRNRIRGINGFKPFEGIYPGLVIHRTNADYLVAHINYLVNADYVSTPHVVLVPVGVLDTGKKMNDSNTTSGGYKGSKMRSTYMDTARNKVISDFGSDYILAHRELLTTGETGWEWVSGCTIELMNEAMVYGSRHFAYHGYNGGTLRSQLAVFRHYHEKQIVTSSWYWLRDISVDSPSANFCRVNADGFASGSGASYGGGVRPWFAIY